MLPLMHFFVRPGSSGPKRSMKCSISQPLWKISHCLQAGALESSLTRGDPESSATDACEANGLAVPELSENTKSALRQFLPASAGISNPVDMIASAGAASYKKTIEAILPGSDIDALIVIYIPVDRNDSQAVAQAICDGVRNARAAGGGGKPVLACLMASEGSRTLITENEVIPPYRFPEAA